MIDTVFVIREVIYWAAWTAAVVFAVVLVGCALVTPVMIGYTLLGRSVAWCRKALGLPVRTSDEEVSDAQRP